MRHLSHEIRPADAIWSLGCLFVLKGATAEVELIDAIAPAGYSPPLHRHDFGTESFYVLEGSARFVIGDSDAVYGPGDFAAVPRSVPHSFEVLGDQPLRVLNIVAPATLWEFFSEVGRPAPELRLPDEIDIPANLPEVVARYDGAVLGPPLNRPGLRIER
jgi:mannose-6-phosphate isomerase-like protein (cupin superfamily)